MAPNCPNQMIPKKSILQKPYSDRLSVLIRSNPVVNTLDNLIRLRLNPLMP